MWRGRDILLRLEDPRSMARPDYRSILPCSSFPWSETLHRSDKSNPILQYPPRHTLSKSLRADHRRRSERPVGDNVGRDFHKFTPDPSAQQGDKTAWPNKTPVFHFLKKLALLTWGRKTAISLQAAKSPRGFSFMEICRAWASEPLLHMHG